jgi:mannose-6-phosphate isomerase-like protein (cupin superfamily)
MKARFFEEGDIFAGLSGSEPDRQRRNWLLGEGDTSTSFAGVFTRRPLGNLASQDWRFHDTEEVEYIAAGAMRVQIADRAGEVAMEFDAHAGDLFYIPAGERHRADAIGDDLCVGILFCPKAYPIPPGQTSEVDAELSPAS